MKQIEISDELKEIMDASLLPGETYDTLIRKMIAVLMEIHCEFMPGRCK